VIQQEDFRTTTGGESAAPEAPPAPLFDERSALRAAPVVPLERVARRERFARWARGWRGTVNTPQFRRSWPLALLVVATLAAGAAALGFYAEDDAPRAPMPAGAATNAATKETPDGADASARAQPARAETEPARHSRDARRGDSGIAPEAAAVGGAEVLAASALGNVLGGAGEENSPRDEAAVEEARGGERERGKRHKRAKRRHAPRRNGGGAILFDVIR
jgi:hypothetical protein